LSGARPLLLSMNLDVPYIQAAFALRPQPPSRFVSDSQSALLAEMNMTLFNPLSPSSTSGAIAVLSAGDPVPPGAQRLFEETAPSPALGSTSPPPITVVVCRLR
jgi:hypothetical protein